MSEENQTNDAGNREWKNKSFLKSVKCTLNGIAYVIRTERNIKIQICFAILAIVCGFIFNISLVEWCIVTILIFMVLSAEMFNTAIEKTVDLCVKEYNETAKIAKDVSSGAVLLTAICSVIGGVIIFLPKVLVLIK